MFRDHGVGLGLRPNHYDYVLTHRPQVPWFEVISENFFGLSGDTNSRPQVTLEKIRTHYPLVLHGVSLSIASAEPLDMNYVRRLKRLVDEIEPLWVSDHLCWTGINGENLHDLLPIPYNSESLNIVCEKIDQFQQVMDRKILFENVSSYLTFTNSTFTEWDFLSEITHRTGCGLLLDINNIFVSSVNHGFDPIEYIKGIPKSAVGQFHLAGHANHGTHLIDTHDHPVCDEVWDLYREAIKVFGPVSTLIEWDANIPEFPVLHDEAKKAEKIREDLFVFAT